MGLCRTAFKISPRIPAGLTDQNDPIALDTTMQHRQITIWHPDAIRDLAVNPTVLLPDGQGEEFPAPMAK
jgi:hypothetical protein